MKGLRVLIIWVTLGIGSSLAQDTISPAEIQDLEAFDELLTEDFENLKKDQRNVNKNKVLNFLKNSRLKKNSVPVKDHFEKTKKLKHFKKDQKRRRRILKNNNLLELSANKMHDGYIGHHYSFYGDI